jgi:hypothetical protein
MAESSLPPFTPPFPPSTHLLFVVENHRPGIGCAICRRPHTRRHPHDFLCERCGLPLHSECHGNRVATPVERLLIQIDLEDDTAGGLVFMCQGCRS